MPPRIVTGVGAAAAALVALTAGRAAGQTVVDVSITGDSNRVDIV